MGEKKGEDLYCNFSRKDIQGLCKKYGLPANKSNFEMAASLIVFLEQKKNLNSTTMWEATRSDPCPSGTSELQVGAGTDSTGSQRKDCGRTTSHSGSGNNQHNSEDVQQNDSQNDEGIVQNDSQNDEGIVQNDPQNEEGIVQNDSQSREGIVTSDKVSENAGILTQLQRDSNNGVGLPENTISSVVSSPIAVRSTDFQFDVRSEDGIQLCVDLNSTPSEWVESMKRGVHICQCHDVPGPRSHGIQEDPGVLCSKQMKSSSVIDLDKEMNSGNFEDESFPATTGTSVQPQAGDPDIGQGSLYSLGWKSCSNTVNNQENKGEKQTLSCRMGFDGEKEVVNGSKSCEREDESVATGSAVNVVTQIRTCNSSGKLCDPEHLGMSKNQISNAGNAIYEKSSLERINGLLNPALKYIVSPTSTSSKIQAPPCADLVQDVAPSPSRAGTSMGLVDQLQFSDREHCGLPQSTQFHGNLHQFQSVQIADSRRYMTCSSKSGRIEDENIRAAVSSKSRVQFIKAQTHLAACRGESMPLSPSSRHDSLGIVNLTNNIEAENGGFFRPREPGKEVVDVPSSMVGVQREHALLSPFSNVVSHDLVVPEQNGANHGIVTCSNKVEEENCKSLPAACVGNLGTSDAGDRKGYPECLDRDLIKRICMKPINSETNGELKRKRQFNGIEDQSNCFNSDSRILRTSKQPNGDVHASRRRSSRLFTK